MVTLRKDHWMTVNDFSLLSTYHQFRIKGETGPCGLCFLLTRRQATRSREERVQKGVFIQMYKVLWAAGEISRPVLQDAARPPARSQCGRTVQRTVHDRRLAWRLRPSEQQSYPGNRSKSQAAGVGVTVRCMKTLADGRSVLKWKADGKLRAGASTCSVICGQSPATSRPLLEESSNKRPGTMDPNSLPRN